MVGVAPIFRLVVRRVRTDVAPLFRSPVRTLRPLCQIGFVLVRKYLAILTASLNRGAISVRTLLTTSLNKGATPTMGMDGKPAWGYAC